MVSGLSKKGHSIYAQNHMHSQMGYKNPAPTQLRISRTKMRKPVGTPFALGSQLNEYCVLAMQTGIFRQLMMSR